MKGYKVIIAIVALSLAAGLFAGYRIWGGRDKGKVDIGQLLHTLEDEVARIEEKNKALVAAIEASRAEVEAAEAIRKENRELKDRLQDAFEEKAALDNSLTQLRAREIDAERQAAVEKELRSTVEEQKDRIASMESRIRALAERIQEAEAEIADKEEQLAGLRKELADARDKASEGEKLKSTIGDLNARISAMEVENRELKSVIDNISDLTQRTQEVR